MRAHITTPPSSARSNPAARSEHERERTRRLGRAAAKEAVVGGIHYARRGRGNRRRLVLERSASPPRPHRSRAVATRRPRRPWRARNSLQLRLEQRRVAPLLRIARGSGRPRRPRRARNRRRQGLERCHVATHPPHRSAAAARRPWRSRCAPRTRARSGDRSDGGEQFGLGSRRVVVARRVVTC